MKQGYITLISDCFTDEVAWKEEDGSPVFYQTIQEANNVIAEDMIEYYTKLKNGEIGLDDVPLPDTVAYCKQVSDTEFEVYDLDREGLLFIWDTKNI